MPYSMITETTQYRTQNERTEGKVQEASFVTSACLIDGMAVVQHLQDDQKTFAESHRIDAVFDDYRDNSI